MQPNLVSQLLNCHSEQMLASSEREMVFSDGLLLFLFQLSERGGYVAFSILSQCCRSIAISYLKFGSSM